MARRTVGILAWLALSTVPAVAQLRVPGTRVTMTPPAGFVVAQQYPGFEQETERASIMVTELPVSAAEMIRSMTAQGLASKGMRLLASEEHVINGKPARLLHVRQSSPQGELSKWLLIAGDQTTTYMVVGSFPAETAGITGDAVRRAVLSTSWQSASPSHFEGLPFRVTATPKLKLAQRVSNMLMFTESGTIGTPGSREALYIAGHSIGRGQIGDLRTFSEKRTAQTNLLKGVSNITGQTVQVDRLEGYELEAAAVDARSGAPMRLYQVILPDETGYFILQGISEAGRANELIPEFKALTSTFRRLAF